MSLQGHNARNFFSLQGCNEKQYCHYVPTGKKNYEYHNSPYYNVVITLISSGPIMLPLGKPEDLQIRQARQPLGPKG